MLMICRIELLSFYISIIAGRNCSLILFIAFAYLINYALWSTLLIV